MRPKSMNGRELYWKRCHEESDRVLKRLGIAKPRCGFDIGLGWIPVVERYLEKMVAAGWDKDLRQVKQKYCQLRIYIGPDKRRQTGKFTDSGMPEYELSEIGQLVVQAEEECDGVCEVCGKERQRKGLGSGWALCDDCGIGEDIYFNQQEGEEEE